MEDLIALFLRQRAVKLKTREMNLLKGELERNQEENSLILLRVLTFVSIE